MKEAQIRTKTFSEKRADLNNDAYFGIGTREDDPERWAPIFPCDKRGTRLLGDPYSNHQRERDGDSTESCRALTTEGIRELPDDLVRHSRFVLAVALRQAISGHQEGAEQDIPDRESAREIGVAALFQRGVMPTVEDRTRQHIFERPEGPAQVGVHEG